MRIFICEDNEEMMRHNVNSIRNALSELRLTADIHTYGDGNEMFKEFKKNNNVDYVFLDIILPSDNGINIARSLRRVNDCCHIIFVTATNRFAIDGYEVNAFRYLLKPLTIESLVNIFNATLKESNSRHLLININQERIPIEKKDIFYAETSGRKTTIQTNKKTYTTYMKLDELESKLDKSFVRCHKSYLANLSYCQRIKANELTLKNAVTLPISRQYIKTVKQAFFEFYNEEC